MNTKKYTLDILPRMKKKSPLLSCGEESSLVEISSNTNPLPIYLAGCRNRAGTNMGCGEMGGGEWGGEWRGEWGRKRKRKGALSGGGTGKSLTLTTGTTGRAGL